MTHLAHILTNSHHVLGAGESSSAVPADVTGGGAGFKTPGPLAVPPPGCLEVLLTDPASSTLETLIAPREHDVSACEVCVSGRNHLGRAKVARDA